MSDLDVAAPWGTRYRVNGADSMSSPRLLIFRDLVVANIDRALALLAGDASRLRPHVKTHKCRQVVELLLERGVRRFKCATVREARMAAQCRAEEVLIAYPLWGPALRDLRRLVEEHPNIDLQVTIDDARALDQLADAMAGAERALPVFLDLDVGMHRTGIPPGDEAATLYAAIARRPHLTPGGLHAYDGHNRQSDPDERGRAAGDTLARVDAFADRLRAEGLPVPAIVIGGTPTFPAYAQAGEVECSPGTFAFHDYGYATRYPDLGFTPAALVLGRVISRPVKDSFTLDIGSKAIAADPPQPRGLLLGYERVTPGPQSEEHWVFEASTAAPAAGECVLVCPTHICPTVALHERVMIVDGSGEPAGEWEIVARGH